MAETVNQLPSISLLGLLRGALRPRTGRAVHGTWARSSYRMPGIDLGQLCAYRHLLGFKPTSTPVTFYYLIAQRAHLATMLGKDFPFKLAGMIHVENSITELAPPVLNEEMIIHNTLHIELPTPTGARYCLFDTVAEQGGVTVFRCASRYLAVRGERRQKTPAVADLSAETEIGRWQLAADTGRKYARVSGDWNPIHLWPWSARLLGLERPIIHGMHTIGKACALIEAKRSEHVSSISARFLAPIALNGEVRLEADWKAGRFSVHADERVAVEGQFKIGNEARIDVL